MAKKKGKKGKGKKSKGFGGLNTSKLMGKAGGIIADAKLLNDFLGKYITDPKMKAIAKIVIGEYAPQQDFIKGFIKDDAILMGGGDAISTLGMKDLFAEMGFAGIGSPEDTDELAVVIEGVESSDMDEDILGEDDDLNTVNEDILGDDDLNVVNEDILGDDEDMDY
jgi:hypothetical protein